MAKGHIDNYNFTKSNPSDYTVSWNNTKRRWEVKDKNNQVVFTDSIHVSGGQTQGVKILRDWLKWNDLAEAPAPQNIRTGFSPEIGSLQVDDPLAGSPYDEFNDVEVLNTQAARAGFFKKTGRQLIGTPQQIRKKVAAWQARAKKHGTGEPLESGRVLGPENLQGSRWNPQTYQYGARRVDLDMETVGLSLTKGSILSIAAIRKAQNLDTGNWDIVDKYSRYYYPTDDDYLLKDARGNPVYDESIAVSGLTNTNIKARREQQLARYSRHFNDKERRRLLNYIGKDPVVGQNVSQFDWPKLFSYDLQPGNQLPERLLPKGGLIDTLHIAEGHRGRAPGLNNNRTLYTLYTGHTPEEDGFTTHDALEDAQITGTVYEHMLRDESRMGKVARTLLHHPGLSSQFRDEMIKGMTEVRGMTPEQQSVFDALLSQTDNDVMIEDIARQQASMTHGGATRAGSLNQLAGIDTSQLSAELQSLHAAITNLASSISSSQNAGLANSSLVKQAASLGTVEERKALISATLKGTTDPTSGAWSDNTTPEGYALARANAIYQARHKGQLEKIEFTPSGWNSPIDHAALANRNGNYKYGWNYDERIMKDVREASPFTGRRDLARGMGIWSAGVGSAAPLDIVGGLSAFGTALGEATKATEKLFGTFQEAEKGVYEAASYFIPKPLKEAGKRYFEAYQNYARSGLLGVTKWTGLAGDLSSGKGFLSAGTNFLTRHIQQSAADKVSRIDLWSGYAELMLAPIKLLVGAFRTLRRHVIDLGRAFLNTIASFRNLGLPLTHLTGVTYGAMQRSYVGDAMIGAGNGTMNNAYNGFAGAQMDLYTYGQLDVNRVIAAAMTGTFGSVYANGGDTQAQYAQTVNQIAARIKTADPRERQRLMKLAGKIDSTMPTVIQQMSNLGISNYQDIQSGKWLRNRGIHQYTAADNGRGLTSDQQRARYSAASMEFTGLIESFKETKNQLAVNLWEWMGKDVMSALNDIFHQISQGNWREALGTAKKKGKEFWGKISTAIFGDELSFDDALSKAKEALANGFDKLFDWVLPKLIPIVTKYVEIVGNGWATIIRTAGSAIDSLVERFKWFKLDIVRGEDGNFHLTGKFLKKDNETPLEQMYLRNELGLKYGSWWGNHAHLNFSDLKGLINSTPEGADAFFEELPENDPRYLESLSRAIYRPDPATGDWLRIKSMEELEEHYRVVNGIKNYGVNGLKPGDKGYQSAYAVSAKEGPVGHGKLYDVFNSLADTVVEQTGAIVDQLPLWYQNDLKKSESVFKVMIFDKDDNLVSEQEMKEGDTIEKVLERYKSIVNKEIRYKVVNN